MNYSEMSNHEVNLKIAKKLLVSQPATVFH